MVLALARPEVARVFPRLWAERGVERVQLGELTRQAQPRSSCARCSASDRRRAGRAARRARRGQRVLPRGADPRGRRRQGRRAARDGARDGRRRASRRSSPRRGRVLRAASVFGQVFWRGGVDRAARRRHDARSTRLARRAGRARARSTVRRDSRGSAASDEYTFRHALVREAAYAMLTERDRTARPPARRRVARGARDARGSRRRGGRLAEHFERGGEPRRADRLVSARRRAGARGQRLRRRDRARRARDRVRGRGGRHPSAEEIASWSACCASCKRARTSGAASTRSPPSAATRRSTRCPRERAVAGRRGRRRRRVRAAARASRDVVELCHALVGIRGHARDAPRTTRTRSR